MGKIGRKIEGIKKSAVKGVFWLTVGSSAEQATRMLRNIILTRILAPEVFGVMAIVYSVNAAFEAISEVGIRQSIIQSRKGNEKKFLNCAWWFGFIRGAALYLAIFLISPLLADFYNNNDLTNITRVSFLVFLFNGMLSSRAYTSLKKMEFAKWAIIQHGGTIIGVVTAVILSIFFIQNIWALVIGFATEALSRCMISYILYPMTPKFSIDNESIKELFTYAQGMFGLPIFTFIFMRADIFVIGKLCTISQLGMYSMAAGVAALPFQFISKSVGSVLMPTFAKKQNDLAWINRWNINISLCFAVIGYPMLAFVAVYGDRLLAILYGEQYAAVSLPFTFLFANRLIMQIAGPATSIYFALGKPQFNRAFTGLRALLMVIMIVPAIKFYGLVGAASAGFIAMLLSFIYQAYRMKQMTDIDLNNYFSKQLYVFLISFGLFIFCQIIRKYFLNTFILSISIGLIGCIATYVLLFFLMDINKIVRSRKILEESSFS